VGMRRAWDTITEAPGYALALDLGGLGVAVLGDDGAIQTRRAAIHYA